MYIAAEAKSLIPYTRNMLFFAKQFDVDNSTYTCNNYVYGQNMKTRWIRPGCYSESGLLQNA